MWTSVSPCPVPRERTRRDAHRHVPPRAHPRCSRVRVPQKTLVLHAVAHTAQAGLTLVHFSAQREHFLSHVSGCFAGFSDKYGSG